MKRRREGTKKLKSRVVKMSNSNYSTSSLVNLFSDTLSKSFSSGGYISSYLVAMRSAATPNRCN